MRILRGDMRQGRERTGAQGKAGKILCALANEGHGEYNGSSKNPLETIKGGEKHESMSKMRFSDERYGFILSNLRHELRRRRATRKSAAAERGTAEQLAAAE